MNNTREWRSLTPTEKDILSKYFEKTHKMTAGWFFTIWIWLGVFVISTGVIHYLTETIKNGFDITLTIEMTLGCTVAFLFFILFGKKLRDDWSRPELNAIMKNKARICEVPILDIIRTFDEDHKPRYKVKVIVSGIINPVYIHIDNYMVSDETIGDMIKIITYEEPLRQETMFAFTNKWLLKAQDSLNF